MKITKIAQIQPQVAQPQQQGQALQGALNPNMKALILQALQGTGLSQQKVIPFLEQLFEAMGDVPISQVTGLLKALSQEQAQQAQQPQQVQAQPPQQMQPDQGVVQQTDQTMTQPSG